MYGSTKQFDDKKGYKIKLVKKENQEENQTSLFDNVN
jgi:hypothetical protein